MDCLFYVAVKWDKTTTTYAGETLYFLEIYFSVWDET